MSLRLTILVLAILPAAAPQDPAPSREEEQRLLQQSVSQVGNSPLEFIRAAERHLARFPKSTLRKEIEAAILKAASDTGDNSRIISYGEKALERGDDPALFDRIARALLASDDEASARRALAYAERLERASAAARGVSKQETARALARALALQARARGNLGELEAAVTKARASYQAFPNAEAAREAGRWELRAGRLEDALQHYADAFTIPDPKVTDANRAHHRTVMGEIHTKLYGSEKGLGELILRAYDRTSAALRLREAALRAENPNRDLQDLFDFRLAGFRGDSLRLATLRGKVIVLDFWTTWCMPCRFQHPLLEKVKSKYKFASDITFLSINADEDRSSVKAFIENLQWSDEIYFEDGLSTFYRIAEIPTTIILNKRGELVARMVGFIPEGFVERLSDMVEQARLE